MSVQLIEKDGQPEYAVLPYSEYIRMVEEIEMLEDIHDFDAAKEALESGEEELIPSEVVYAILDGKNPLKVWREQRGLTQAQLAGITRISPAYLSQIENGKRLGATSVLARIAEALHVTLDDLVRSA